MRGCSQEWVPSPRPATEEETTGVWLKHGLTIQKSVEPQLQLVDRVDVIIVQVAFRGVDTRVLIQRLVLDIWNMERLQFLVRGVDK